MFAIVTDLNYLTNTNHKTKIPLSEACWGYEKGNHKS